MSNNGDLKEPTEDDIKITELALTNSITKEDPDQTEPTKDDAELPGSNHVKSSSKNESIQVLSKEEIVSIVEEKVDSSMKRYMDELYTKMNASIKESIEPLSQKIDQLESTFLYLPNKIISLTNQNL